MTIAEELTTDDHKDLEHFIFCAAMDSTGGSDWANPKYEGNPDYVKQTYTFADGSRMTVVVTTD
jgi:hypothetical protein